MKISLLILSFFPLTLFANSPRELLSEVQSLAPQIKKEYRKEAELIYKWLSKTHEIRIHQLRGATDNQLFLHRNGQIEAVYDGKGKLVRDGINDGSYNYAHPYEDPINHFLQDILPWIYYGYSRKDPTSITERLEAYSMDLGAGLTSAQEQKVERLTTDELSTAELEGIAIFMEVIKAGKVEEIYEILLNPEYESKNPFEIGKRLTEGLIAVFGE